MLSKDRTTHFPREHGWPQTAPRQGRACISLQQPPGQTDRGCSTHRCPNTGEMGRALASQIRPNYLRLKAHSAGLQLIGSLLRSLHVANAERILKKLSYLMQTWAIKNKLCAKRKQGDLWWETPRPQLLRGRSRQQQLLENQPQNSEKQVIPSDSFGKGRLARRRKWQCKTQPRTKSKRKKLSSASPWGSTGRFFMPHHLVHRARLEMCQWSFRLKVSGQPFVETLIFCSLWTPAYAQRLLSHIAASSHIIKHRCLSEWKRCNQ